MYKYDVTVKGPAGDKKYIIFADDASEAACKAEKHYMAVYGVTPYSVFAEEAGK